jgi:hypothetical protein
MYLQMIWIYLFQLLMIWIWDGKQIHVNIKNLIQAMDLIVKNLLILLKPPVKKNYNLEKEQDSKKRYN